MRIGIDVTGLGSGQRYTGMGEYAYQLISHLAPITKDEELILIGYEEDALADFGTNCRKVVLPPQGGGKFRSLVSHQLYLPRVAQSLQLDLLHIPWVHVRPSLPAVPWYKPCPLVVTLHDVIPLVYYQGKAADRLPKRLEWFYHLHLRLVARADCVVTVSNQARTDILQFTPIASQQIRVIYNGSDFTPLHLPPMEARKRREVLNLPERYLLYAGSYEPRKNLRGTLAAYAYAVTAGVELPLVMIVEKESGHAPAVLAYAHSLNLDSQLHFLHSLSQDDLRFVYSGAELFLFPSFYEGFGFPPLQAMQCTVPVITARNSSLPEILGEAAYYVDPTRSEMIGDAILTLLRDEGLRNRLVASGLVRSAQYSWHRAADQMLQLYRDVVATS